MSLLDRILARGFETPTDPIIAVRVERHLRRIQPDPMFRRRLRGRVLNRYVATREGLVPAAPPAARRREMRALGRGVLYASLLTAMGVSVVGAAAQESIPGDALHAVKLQLEEARMRIAPPGLRDDLAAMALDERLEEVERLAAAGRWQLVDEAAALAAVAEQQLAGVMATGSGSESGEQASEDAIQRHADRIEVLIGTAPVSARDSLRRAWQASTADIPPAAAEPPASHPSNGSHQRSDGEQPEDPAQVRDAPVQEPDAPAHEPAAPSKPPSAQR